jgi:hypothetical protein
VRSTARWAKVLLSARMALVADGDLPFVALGLPCMISCTVHEQSSLCLFLWYKLQGTGHRFLHPVFSLSSLHNNNSISLASSTLVALSCLVRERWLMMTIVENVLVMRALVAVVGHRCPAG